MARVLCVEIGYATTRLVEMDYKVKNPILYQCLEVATPKDAVIDGYISRDRIEEVRDAILNTLEENMIKTNNVVFSVYSSKIITREVMLPAVKLKQVAGVIEANLSEYFPMDLEDHLITHKILHTFDKDDENAGRHRTLLVAAEKELIRAYEYLADICGWTIESIDYMGNAVQQAVKSMVGQEAEMFVKIEPESAVVTIIKDGAQALQRTANYGIGRPIMDKADLDEAIMMLTGTLQRIIDFYTAQSDGNPVTAINVIGTFSENARVLQTMQDRMGIPCQYLPNIDGVKQMLTVSADVWISAYVGCIGASFAPIGMMNIQPKGKYDVDYFNASLMLIVLIILSCVAITFAAISPYQEALEEQASLKAQEEMYAPAKAVYQQYTTSMELYKKVVVGNLMTMHANEGLLIFLEELEKKLPRDAHVLEFASNDMEAVIKMQVADKETAAGVIKMLREFDSVMSLTVDGLSEETEDREGEAILNAPTEHVEFIINCLYYPFEVKEPEAVEANADTTATQQAQ